MARFSLLEAIAEPLREWNSEKASDTLLKNMSFEFVARA
jgi:hypothetical protein